MDSRPLVSIMMPAYNAGNYIYDAIESIQRQTYQNWELCIVDDGSEDCTYAMAMACANEDERIRVKSIQHAGCPTARNACLKMMRGAIYARQDADDTCSPVRLERQVDFLINNPDHELVTCRYNWLKGGITIPQRAEGMSPKQYLVNKGGRPVNATIVTWSQVYEAAGPFIARQLAGSDGDWNFRVLQVGFRWGYIPEYLYTQRRHAGQISQRLRGQQAKTHEEALREYGKLGNTTRRK